MTRILIGCSLLLLTLLGPVLGQSPVRQADRQFDLLAYSKAIELYEQALSDKKSWVEADRMATLNKLAYSYRQVHDDQNALRVYQEMLSKGDLPAEYASAYLHYAQALASNGKYAQAQEAYEKYMATKRDDERGGAFAKLYKDVSVLSRNVGSYKVEFLELNTTRPEFSPIYYQDGIVFVSANGDAGIKRVFNWSNTPFLDLYYLPELKTVKVQKTASLGGGLPPVVKTGNTRLIRPLGRDDFTAPTSNDTRTVGFYGGANITAGSSYEDEPVTASDLFSRTLNTKYHEGPATFSRDGSRIIFTRNNYNNGRYNKSSDGVNKLKLYTAEQTNGNWKKIEELPFNSDEYSTGHPSLSKDDQLLYFSSDMPGGFGGTDIYVCRWVGSKWGTPVNLGTEVNTKGNEMFPFADEKGNLYFSSDGQPGMGGLDLFYANLTDNGQQVRWIQNLGEPINSNKDDFGIVTDGDRRTGFFSSNRKHGGEDDDLYRFNREGPMYPCRELIVNVFDAQTKQPLANTTIVIDEKESGNDKRDAKTDAEGNIRLCLEAEGDFRFMTTHEGYVNNQIGFSTRGLQDDKPSRLEIPLDKEGVDLALAEPPVATETKTMKGRITAQQGNKPLGGVKVILKSRADSTTQEAVTKSDGSYEFVVKPGVEYDVEAEKEGMATIGGRIDKTGAESPTLKMFTKGDVMQVENIYYDLDKADIRPDAATELDKVADLMAKYPKMRIELRSHTDSRATTDYNKTLSTNRAKAAVSYLKAKGISAKRLKAAGFGESELLNDCKDGVDCPDEKHQQNRRTEIKILTLN